MDPLSITASIIAVIQLTGTVVSAVYGYRKDVKNAPEDAARIIQDLIGLSQILEKLLQMIEQERSAKTTLLSSVEGLFIHDGPLESCQKTLERLNAKLQPEDGWRGVKQSLIWPLKKDYIQKTLDDIATAKATVDLALTVDQVSLAIDTKDGVDALTTSFETFRFDATISHLKARKKHQDGTSDWLLASKQYLEWVDAADSFFWINGIPGCGKTILCSVAIEDLLQNQQQNKVRTGVAYYYFNFQTREEQQFVNLLRSITLQLSCQCPILPKSVEMLEWQAESAFSSEYLVGIVRDLLKEFQDVYVVIDALDECEQFEEMLRWIESLLENKNDRLHLLVSSRQDHHFQREVECLASLILNLGQQNFEKDIEIYIHERLSTDPRMMKWPSDVGDDIQQSLVSHAEGLFRWVECQLDVLRKCIRINNIKVVLDSPPKTLYETYDRILTSIDEAYVEDAYTMLQWLAFSTRPLKMNELNEVLAFDRSDPHNPAFSPKLRLPLPEDVLTLCSSLITVSDRQAIHQADSGMDTLEIRLAHHSVKDYVTSHHIKKGSTRSFALQAQLAHAVMAECCLVYLLQFHSRLDALILQQFPLAPYAAQSWTEHYRSSKESHRGLLDKLAVQLLTTEIFYQNSCCLHNPDRRWQGLTLEADQSPSALYYASLTGLSPIVVRSLIANGADPNKGIRRGCLGEALDAAAYKGNQDLVQALLDAGAEPDGGYWEGECGPPIAAAASQGQNTVVKMLLRAGADVHRRGSDGVGSAMFQAVVHRHLETVKMLVGVGASVDAYEGMSGLTYAIEVAADRGDREILYLLYSKASKWTVERALRAVSRSGDREVFVSLLQYQRGRELELKTAALAGWDDLVQRMVDENLEDDTYECSTAPALVQAAAAGSLEITQILYENGVEAAFSTNVIGKAVAAAAGRGHALVVQYLLDRGADTGDESCQNALLRAAGGGFLSTVQVLLTAGVPANPRTRKTTGQWELKTCLWAAVDQEHIEIVRLLLSHGADPDSQYTGISALETSIQKGNEDLFHILLQNGASTAVGPVQHAHYDTLAIPLHCAASAGNMNILRVLLARGLEIDSVLIPDGWTALFHAAKAGHEDVLRLLINDYGADANRRANKGTVAIHTAAYHNHEKCIEVFLDAGVDVNIRGKGGRTALHWAAQEGSIEAVRVLLERNANVFIEEKNSFMKAADIVKAKILEIAESKKSSPCYRWKHPHDENYEPILEMLEDRAARSQEDRSNTHGSTFRRKFGSVLRRRNGGRLSPP